MHGGRGGHSEPGGRQVDARAAHREGLDEDLHGGPTKAGHHAPFLWGDHVDVGTPQAGRYIRSNGPAVSKKGSCHRRRHLHGMA